MNWIDTNYDAITRAMPEECAHQKPQIPRERAMGLIMQYHEAFEGTPDLLEMVFWKEITDPDVLLAEISAAKGDTYVASRQKPDSTTTKLGGNYRPTFGKYGQSDDINPMGDALMIVMTRARRLVCGEKAYDGLKADQKTNVRLDAEAIVGTILTQDGVIK